MLQILNSTERNQAFLKFLLFFLITVSLIVWAVYFNFRMPQRENVMLKSEVQLDRQREVNQMNFAEELDKTIFLLDSLGKQNTNTTQIHLQIDQKIIDLHSLRETHSPTDGRINNQLVTQLQAINNLKKEIVPLREKEKRVADLESQLKECQRDLDNARKSLNVE